MDGPGDRAQRVLAYGLNLNAMVRESVEHFKPWLIERGYYHRICKRPRWEQVEIFLGLYECLHWSTEMPDASREDRAIWCVEREMALFHKHVIRDE